MPSANIIREGYPGILADGTPAVPLQPLIAPVVDVEEGTIFVSVNTNVNPVVLTLPSASRYIGQILLIRATIPGANPLNVNATGNEVIIGTNVLSASGYLLLIGARFNTLTSGVSFGWASITGV